MTNRASLAVLVVVAAQLISLVAAIDLGMIAAAPMLCQHALQSALHGGDIGFQLPFYLPTFKHILSDFHLHTQLLTTLDPQAIPLPADVAAAADVGATAVGAVALPAVTADAVTVAADTVFPPVDMTIEERVGSLWNNWRSSFEALLDKNPDFKLSSTEYAAKTFNQPVQDYFGGIYTKFNTFLDENPKWKLSTSEFAEDFWQSEVLVKSQEASAVLAESPLAQGTKELLTKLSALQSATDAGALKAPLPSVSTSQAASEITNQFKKVVGEKVLESFDQVLNENPKLKLSTSEYVKDYYNNEFLPQWQYFAGVVSQSPLAKGTQQFASTSTSEFTAKAVASAAEKFGPVVAPITQPIFSPIVDFVRSSREALQAATQSVQSGSAALSNVLAEGTKSGAEALQQLPNGVSISPAELSLPEMTIPSVPLPDADALVRGAVSSFGEKLTALTEQVVQVLAKDAVPAVNKAAVTLGGELADAGTTLASRTANWLTAFGNGVTDIVTDAIEIIPSRTAELVASGSNTASELSTTATAQLSAKINDLTTNSDVITAEAKNIADRVQQWKFFSDDSHWETGYWEQQYKGLAKLAQNLADPDQRQQLLELSQKTLSDAGDRFIAKYQEARSGYKDFDSRVLNAAEKIKERSSELQAVSSKLVSELEQIDTSGVGKIANAITKDVSSLLEDTRSYVDEFINTNTDM